MASHSANRSVSAILAVLGVLAGGLAFAQAPSIAVPDPKLTPGAIASISVSEVCSRGYSRAHRTWDRKAETLAKYGIARSSGHLYEDDDRVPICAGGNNADPRNHWPQPWTQARVKDEIEWRVCAAVCDGRVPLVLAQSWFLDDWRLLLGKKLP